MQLSALTFEYFSVLFRNMLNYQSLAKFGIPLLSFVSCLPRSTVCEATLRYARLTTSRQQLHLTQVEMVILLHVK